MTKFDVTVHVFAAGGDTIRVEAANEDDATLKAKMIAVQRYHDDLIKCDVQEVSINHVEEVPEDRPLPKEGAEYLIDCAAVHSEQSDNPDHEVGDLQMLLRVSWKIMNDEQRRKLMDEAGERDLTWQ